MLENLRRQEASYPQFNNGSSMPSSVRARTFTMLQHLEGLYFGDTDAVAKFGDVEYWVNLSQGMLSVSSDAIKLDVISPPAADLKESIAERGYHINPRCSSLPINYSAAIASTLVRLRSKGWPPQFLLMYDEVWTLLMHACKSYEPLLGVDMMLESDVNIWSLRKGEAAGTYVGGNFANPHRDIVYSGCHDDNEETTSLSVWIPLNVSGATASNGCMRVVPIECDDFFYSPEHPRHSENKGYCDGGDEIKLVCEQFGACAWDPTCVHSGGGCDADAVEEPRTSLAFTVRRGSARKSEFAVGLETVQTGPAAVQVQDAGKGGVKRRLQVVAKAVLSYSHHWPGMPFEGFAESLQDACVHHTKAVVGNQSAHLPIVEDVDVGGECE